MRITPPFDPLSLLLTRFISCIVKIRLLSYAIVWQVLC